MNGLRDDLVQHEYRSTRPASLPDLGGLVHHQLRGQALNNNTNPSACGETNGLMNGAVRMRTSDAAGVLVGCRLRIPTQEGREYQMNVHDWNRTTGMKKITKLMQSVRPLNGSYESAERVQRDLQKINQLFSEVVASHGKYHRLKETFSEQEQSSKWMNDLDAMVFEFNQSANRWLTNYEEWRERDHDSHFHRRDSVYGIHSHDNNALQNEHSGVAVDDNLQFHLEQNTDLPVDEHQMSQVHSSVGSVPNISTYSRKLDTT